MVQSERIVHTSLARAITMISLWFGLTDFELCVYFCSNWRCMLHILLRQRIVNTLRCKGIIGRSFT